MSSRKKAQARSKGSKKNEQSFVGDRPINRAARKFAWAMMGKKEPWPDSMLSIPQYYPLIHTGYDKDGKKVYTRKDEIGT